MASVKLLSWNPVIKLAWYELNNDPANRRPCMGISSAEAAEAKRLEILAELEAKEAEEAEDRQERQRAIDAEAVAQAIAKAAVTPKALSFLTFLRLIKYKETCPYFDDIRTELDRLAADPIEEEA